MRADEVRIELAGPDAMASDAERTACEAILSAGEHARAARIRSASARDHFVLAHALARGALARAAAVAPARIEIRAGPRGKPEIAAPPEAVGIHFNLSHTDGLAACALAHGAAVGVDVEARDRKVEPLGLAARFFAPSEAAALRALDAAQRRERFLALWTLKEAVLKALGVGIAGGLAAVAFDLEAPLPRLLPGALAGDPGRWQLALLSPTPRHVLALAVLRSAAPDRKVRVEFPPDVAAASLGGLTG